LFGAATVCCLLVFFNPSVDGFFPPCFFYKLTDLYCPGCGATRACDSLLEGKVTQAFGFNPLFISCFPFALYFLVRWAWSGIVLNEEYEIDAKFSPWLVGVGILTLAFAVVRNIPIEALSWLRPG
jgi:hypothetical protein